MRLPVPAIAGALAGLIAAGVVVGSLSAPAVLVAARGAEAPFLIPNDLSYRFAIGCTEECLERYDRDERSGLSFVDSYERARLWEWYHAVTVPCLAAQGVRIEPVARSEFFLVRERPWNPYVGFEAVAFDELVRLYRACPPVPESLRERHLPG